MAREKQTKLDPGDAERAAKEAAERDKHDPAVEAAEYEAYAKYQRELIAEFQEHLRAHKVKLADDDARRHLEKLRLVLARAAFRGVPLEGYGSKRKAELGEAARAAARIAVLDTAAANARHIQRSVTRGKTADADHADIRDALRAEVAKRRGKLVRGEMKRIYSDVCVSITKARHKEGREGVSERTVKRVWADINR